MNALSEYRAKGFSVVLAGDDAFKVIPASSLTQEERDFLRLHKAEILSELSAEHTSDESAARSASSTLARVATSTSSENGGFGADQNDGLSTADLKTLHDYLALIGETDDAMITEYLAECASNPSVLASQLQQARDALRIAQGDTSAFTRCIGCKHLSGDICHKHQAKVIINRWRRCGVGKTLEHFASLDKALH